MSKNRSMIIKFKKRKLKYLYCTYGTKQKINRINAINQLHFKFLCVIIFGISFS